MVIEPAVPLTLARAAGWAVIHYTIQYYTILYYTTLHYTILHYTILYYTILYSDLGKGWRLAGHVRTAPMCIVMCMHNMYIYIYIYIYI